MRNLFGQQEEIARVAWHDLPQFYRNKNKLLCVLYMVFDNSRGYRFTSGNISEEYCKFLKNTVEEERELDEIYCSGLIRPRGSLLDSDSRT